MTGSDPHPSTDRFRVVVTDHAYPDLSAEREVLGAVGATVHDAQTRDHEKLIEAVRDADAVLVQFARIDAEVLAAMRHCRVVVRYGIGVDGVDLDAATEHGIPVANVPDYGLDEVADHAMTLLLALARKLPQVAEQVRAGVWEPNPFRPLHSLRGRTLGLVGLGAIARRVAARAHAFGLDVQAFDPYVEAGTFDTHGVAQAGWEDLLATSDFVSLHLPLSDATHHLFDAAAFAGMKRGAFFVNTARGGLVRTEDLLAALDDERVAGAALDVLEREPPPRDAPVVQHPRVLVTSHCAWYTEEARQRVQRFAAEEVARVLRGEGPKNLVNPAVAQRT